MPAPVALVTPVSTTLVAQTNPPADGNGFGTFSLMLIASAYLSTVQIYGTKATLADKPVRPGSGFVLLGTLDSIPNGGLNIADLYLAKFGPPPSGAQVALQVVPVSPTGTRGAPMLLEAITDVPAQAALTGDHELPKAA